MYYSMPGLAFEGLAWVLIKGLVYGLILLVLLWAAIELARWGFRALKRGLAKRRPPAGVPDPSSIRLRLVATGETKAHLEPRSNDSEDVSRKEAA